MPGDRGKRASGWTIELDTEAAAAISGMLEPAKGFCCRRCACTKLAPDGQDAFGGCFTLSAGVASSRRWVGPPLFGGGGCQWQAVEAVGCACSCAGVRCMPGWQDGGVPNSLMCVTLPDLSLRLFGDLSLLRICPFEYLSFLAFTCACNCTAGGVVH